MVIHAPNSLKQSLRRFRYTYPAMKTVMIVVVILIILGGSYFAYKKYASSSQAPQEKMSAATGQQFPRPSGGMEEGILETCPKAHRQSLEQLLR